MDRSPGNCIAFDDMVILVNHLFIPSVITPNGDGANDFFQIKDTEEKELIVLNRWGIIEYSSTNYLNNWDGRNNTGNALREDTYFYIVKLGMEIQKKDPY